MAILLVFDGSAMLDAVRVTMAGAGRFCGAVKVPRVLTTPQEVPAHPVPEMDQEIPELGWPAEVVAAANVFEEPSSMEADGGVRETTISLLTWTAAAPLLEGSATLVASTVTLPDAGRIAGVVYTPVASIVPEAAFPPGIPFTLQITAVFVVLLTVAENVCGSPSNTEAEEGVTFTETGGGGCGGPEPTTPPQPRNDATRSIAGHQ